jgi:hypothetical protein
MKIPTTLLLVLVLMGTLFSFAHPARAGIDMDGQGNAGGKKTSRINR